MEFEKKMKQRLYMAYLFILFGIVLVAVAVWKQLDNEFFFAYGVALLVIGIVRIRQYRKQTASPEAMRFHWSFRSPAGRLLCRTATC